MNKSTTELGGELRRLRKTKDLTLREVQEATGVSNAYLCQLETGKANSPHPRVLKALAEYYSACYGTLMALAGMLVTEPTKQKYFDAVFSVTSIEENALRQFLTTLRTYDLLKTAQAHRSEEQ